MFNRRVLLAAAASLTVARASAARDFSSFLAGLRAEARLAGISAPTVARALAGIRPNARVIELDRRQPEFTLSWAEYRARVLPGTRLALARETCLRERPLLDSVSARFGVDPGILVGIWGIESNFGANKGSYNLVESLATLAWEGRRAGFFRAELLNALRILDKGDVSPSGMTAGWAGAMGQPQFMPSSYLRYAVDFDGDGRRDIWDSVPDVLGSIGNYMAGSGWQTGAPWGQRVALPAGFDASLAGRENRRPLGAWMALGVRRADGTPFGRDDVPGALVLPDGAGGEAYMTYANFAAIRRYNASDYYALAVGLLGNAAMADGAA